MIKGYTKPQSIIRQILQRIPDPQTRSLNAFIFGPQFDLFRYTVEGERAAMTGQLFEEISSTDHGDWQLIPYEGLAANHVIDKDFTRLFAEKLEGQLWLQPSADPNEADSEVPYTILLDSLANPNKLHIIRRGARLTLEVEDYLGQLVDVVVEYGGTGYAASSDFDIDVVGGEGTGGVIRLTSDSDGVITSGVIISPGSGYAEFVFDAPAPATGAGVAILDSEIDTLIPELHGRSIKAGDVVYANRSGEAEVTRRTVKRIEREKTASSFGVDTDKNNKQFGAGDKNPIETLESFFGNTSTPSGWNLTLSHNTILSSTVTAAGTGYTSAPDVTISDPVAVKDKLVDATTPAHPSANASADADIDDAGTVTGITITAPGAGYADGGLVFVKITTAGSGYTTPPTVTVPAPAGAEGIQAVVEALVSGGAVVGYKILETGSGYESRNLTLTFSGGGGTGAAATAYTTYNHGVKSVTITSAGSGYSSAPTISFAVPNVSEGERATGEAVITSGGALAGIKITKSGWGYTSAPAVTISGNATATSALGNGPAISLTAAVFSTRATATVKVKSLRGDWNGLVEGALYDTRYGSRYVITVTKGGVENARVRIRSNNGSFSAENVDVKHLGFAHVISHSAFGGLNLEIKGHAATTPLRLGDSFVFVVLGEYSPIELDAGGGLSNIVIEHPGAGHSNGAGQSLTISAPPEGGTQATATCTVAGGLVTATVIVNAGSGYVVPPFITLTGSSTTPIFSSSISAPEDSRHLALLQNATYTGTKDTTYQVTVVEGNLGTANDPFGGAIVRISDSAGVDVNRTLTVVHGSSYFDLGTLGLRARFPSLPTNINTPQIGLRTGDVYYVYAQAELADGAPSIIVTNGQVTEISDLTETSVLTQLFDIDVRLLFTGEIEPHDVPDDDAPDAAFLIGGNGEGESEDGGILIRNGLKVFVTDRDEDYQWVPAKESLTGYLFSHWRGLVPATSGDKIKLYSSEAELLEKFGLHDLDNPVCYGAITAFRGAQGKAVYAARLSANTLAGYSAILKQAERVDGVYAMAPMTMDLDVQLATEVHVKKVSAEDWKLWRRVYVSTRNPGPFVVMDTDSDDQEFQGSVLANATGNLRVICENGDFLIRGIRPDDLFRTNFSTDAWGNDQYDQYVVQTVNENDELILVSGPDSPISPAVRFEIWRPNSGLSQTEFVGERSDEFTDRRVCNVWTDTPLIFDANDEPVATQQYYLAAEIAGLRSAAVPQQGLTYTELNHAVDSIPNMYLNYTTEELNQAAKMGTMIVTQDTEDSPIYIRHQLTTDVSSGSLYYEDSVGANLDAISYAIKDIIDPYIGKRNATLETVEELQTRIRAKFAEYQASPGGFTLIGPAIIAVRSLTVAIDPVFKDRINIEAELELPLPLNTIFVTLKATTIQNETLTTTTTVA